MWINIVATESIVSEEIKEVKKPKKISSSDIKSTIPVKDRAAWKKMKDSFRKLWILQEQTWDTETLSTWSIWLDYALGWGIWANKIIQVLWESGSWKSTLCMHIVRKEQERGWKVMVVDMENAFNQQRVESIWVNYNDLHIIIPENGNDAIDKIAEALREQTVTMILWDWIDSSIPKKILMSDSWESHMWVNARMISEAMRKFNALLKGKTTLVITNQYRINLGVTYWDNLTTTWGKAPMFYSSQVIRINKLAKAENQVLNSDWEKIWTYLKMKVIKNRIWEPDRVAEVNLMFNWAIKEWAFIFEKLVKVGILTKEKLTYYRNWEKIWSKALLIEFYASDLDMYFKDADELVRLGRAENQKREPIDNNPF